MTEKIKKTNWNLLMVFGAITIIYFLFRTPDNSSTTTVTIIGTENEKALSEIRKEEKIKEALITEANVLYVSVLDDGTKRDGYAQYLCEVLKDFKTSIKRVKVVKVNSTNDPGKDNAYGVLLGESFCN